MDGKGDIRPNSGDDSGGSHSRIPAGTGRKFTEAERYSLIVNYASAQELLRPRQPDGRFSPEVYSFARRHSAPGFEIPDERTYKIVWEAYRANPSCFPKEEGKIKYVKAYARAMNCIKTISWVKNVVKHSPAKMPTALGNPEMWVKRQYCERELSEREQEGRNKFALDFHRIVDSEFHERICFTGQIILEAGASVRRLAYDIFKQEGGGKRLLVIVAMQKQVGLVGPYYFELADGQDSISAQEYLTLLRTKIVPALCDKLSVHDFRNVTFQQDGHEYQEHPDTMSYLKCVFRGKVISRHGDKLCWPNWSKDLNPVQYCIETALMRTLARRKSIPDSFKNIKVVLDSFFSKFPKREAILIASNEFPWRLVAVCEHEGEEIEYFFQHFRNELNELGLICLGLSCFKCNLCQSEECECLNHHKYYNMTAPITVNLKITFA